MVLLQVSELLEGDRFPDLTAAALGTWVRLKAMTEITGEPISARQIERHGFDNLALTELSAAGLLTEADGCFEAIGMPEPERKPSDRPDAWRERQQRSRANRAPSPAPSPVRSDQLSISSGVTPSRVTGRDGTDSHADDAPGPHQAEIDGVLCRWTNV